MSPASSKLRQTTTQALRKKPNALLPSSKTTHTRRLLPKQPRRRQTEATRPHNTKGTSSGTPGGANIRLSQRGLPLLFLWLTTEGIEAGGPATMLTRPAAAWKPQTDHLGRLATTNMVSQNKEGIIALT